MRSAFSLCVKVVNPHDEVKGSNPFPCAYFEGISKYQKLMRAKILSMRIRLDKATSTSPYMNNNNTSM